jgi:hypothetical protein
MPRESPSLDLATVEQIVEELARRRLAFALVLVRPEPSVQDPEVYCDADGYVRGAVRFLAGTNLALGLAMEAGEDVARFAERAESLNLALVAFLAKQGRM